MAEQTQTKKGVATDQGKQRHPFKRSCKVQSLVGGFPFWVNFNMGGVLMYFNFKYKILIRNSENEPIKGYKFAETEERAKEICKRLNDLGFYTIYCIY